MQLGGKQYVGEGGVAIAVSKTSTRANAIIDMVFANFVKQNSTTISANALIA